MKTVKITKEQVKHLHNFVEDHMFMCAEYLNEVQEEGSEFEPYAPYDGCYTCETREMLEATFDWLRANKVLDLLIDDVVEFHSEH